MILKLEVLQPIIDPFKNLEWKNFKTINSSFFLLRKIDSGVSNHLLDTENYYVQICNH